MQYESFPQPEEIKSAQKQHVLGMNKSGRGWKVGVNRTPQKNFRNKGNRMTWDQKKKRAGQMKDLRDQIKDYKVKKIEKKKEQKEFRKLRKRQKEYNEIKAGKFQVIKNTKNISKWSKKLKQKLVKLPAEVFESLVNK